MASREWLKTFEKSKPKSKKDFLNEVYMFNLEMNTLENDGE
jgi:hypothetical protein